MEDDFSECVHGAVEDQVSSGSLIERVHRFVGVCNQHRRKPIQGVSAPGGVGGVDHRLGVTTGDASAFGVGVDCFGASVAEVEGCGLLPLVDEAVNVDEFRRVVAVVHEEREGAAGGDGLQLRPVTHEQHLRTDLHSVRGDAVERESARE